MVQTTDVTLVSNESLNESVKHFVFQMPKGQNFAFTPGQFIRLFIPHDGDKPLARSYSLAQMHEGELIELAASYVENGLASEHLFNEMKIGDTIKMSGPFGRLTLKPEETPKRYIFLATNTGITPFRSMLPELQSRITSSPDLKVYLYQGVRTPEDLLYGNDFNQLAQKYPENFFFIPCYSRADPPAQEPGAKRGYVQEQLPAMNCKTGEDIVYLCGNPNMVDAAYQQLSEAGLSMQEIRREKYISP